MNTPTHIMISLASLTQRDQPGSKETHYLIPAAVGAVLPDAPMFVFYGVEKFWTGSSERAIWTTQYFLPAWQDFFDMFNSLPLVAAGMLITLAIKNRWATILFASMLLHIGCDLPLHHDDGHRHFWPLSDWRFESPVSYWDPNHFGVYAGIAELVLFLICFVIAMRRQQRLPPRIGIALLATAHLAFIGFALIYWVGL